MLSRCAFARRLAGFAVTVAAALFVAGCNGGSPVETNPPDPNPVPDIRIEDANRFEGNSGRPTMIFPVTLSVATDKVVTVDYATSDGSAIAGADYIAASGRVSIPAGATAGAVEIELIPDTVEEIGESFSVTISNAVNGTIVKALAAGVILDDDGLISGSGLDTRPANATCIAPARPASGGTTGTVDAFPASPGFAFATKILQAPGDASRWFVLEKNGLLKVFDTAAPGSVATYLDFSGAVRTASEGGLLGLAFDPDFPATPELYVYYTAPGSPMQTVVSRIVLDDTDAPVAPAEQIILTVDQTADNHNGGDIAFGADGFLYIGLGDGGGSGDPQQAAQDTTRLLGSMLRLDVRGAGYPSPGYRIPAGNPFAANPRCGPASNALDCPEIYAWGLRNPWRWSFDPATGALWAGDVGQSAWEEIDVIERGGNYGWDVCEGNANFEGSTCPDPAFVAPVAVYPHASGNFSVTGGFVYRGTAIPALEGRYVFGDFGSGHIWALADDGQGGFDNEQLLNTPYAISSFGQGEDGELYFVDYAAAGKLHRLVQAASGPADTIPADLTATGCVMPADISEPADGLVPYAINAPFWSDGAAKGRYMAVPDAATIDIGADGDFDFPPGTVLVKFFGLNGRTIETRLLMRHPDGVWAGYTYEWNDQQTQATRVVGGKTRMIDGQPWRYPSEGECMQCHTAAAGFTLGLEGAQLNRAFRYPSTGRLANQLTTLEAIGMLSAPLPGPPQSLPAFVNPDDTGAPLDARARAYLHTNCAQCHRPGGPAPTALDLRRDTPLSATGACDAVPQAGDLGIAGARIIAPGDADRSVLVERMNRRDAHGMPPLASGLVDTSGVALVRQWIDSLAGCTP